MNAQLNQHQELAEELRQPFYQYINVSFRAMPAIFEGQFDEGQRLAHAALGIGQRLRGQDASGVFEGAALHHMPGTGASSGGSASGEAVR